MKIIYTTLALSFFFFLYSCNNSTELELGEKTIIKVNEVFDAGEVMKGKIIEAKFSVKNEGKNPLIIGEVRGSCACTVASKPTEPIQPGDTKEIIAKVNTDKMSSGKISKSVRIVANTEPSVTIVTIKAKINI